MAQTLDNVRHARERGMILHALMEEYSGRLTRTADLAGALDLLGYPMSMEDLGFHLVYLSDEGYVRVVRAGETPGYRRDRLGAGDPDAIVFCKLLPKGLRLIDGTEPENPGVRF